MPDSQMILGWDVGGTKSGAVVGTSDGSVLADRTWPSQTERGPDAMINEFVEQARSLLADRPEIAALGVSIGGPLNPLTGMICSPPHLPGWDQIPLADTLAEQLGLPVVVEHDAAACLEAEALWGAARGCSHAAYFTCGTGFGAGILIDGRVLRGPNGESPELGHVRIAPDGPVCFDKAGCAESFCSGTGIARLAPFMFPDRFDGPVEARRLSELAAAGDQAAQAVLDTSGRRTGQVCALLADLLAPQVIVLGSLARYLGEPWLAMARTAFDEEALKANRQPTRIVPPGLGEKLQPLSAIAPVVFRQG